MPIKVKNYQLNNDTLGVLNELIELDINASSAFKLSRIIKSISSIVEDKIKFEKKIYDKWVVKDENGNPKVPKDENGDLIKGAVEISDVSKFQSDMEELMEVENILPFDKLNFENLNLEKAKIKDIIKIEFLFN